MAVVWVVAALVVVLVVLGVVGLTAAASSPRVCASCHEMQPKVAQWRVSPHAEVRCYRCHATPQPWYRWPRALIERGAMLTRDVRAHRSGDYTIGDGAPIPDANCLQCHDPARTGTSRFGVRIKHAEHAERNNSCVSCHRWTAHPSPVGSRDTAMMALCFKCHGLSEGAKAPGACDVCHLKGLDLRSESHKTGDWKALHGDAAKADRKQCAICHVEKFCRDCHGLEIPHPEGWTSGKTGHSVVAARDRKVCEQCHRGKTNLCSMCHHKGYDGAKGPWVSRHYLMVQETGSAFCMQCHQPTFCVRCHSNARPANSSAAR